MENYPLIARRSVFHFLGRNYTQYEDGKSHPSLRCPAEGCTEPSRSAAGGCALLRRQLDLGPGAGLRGELECRLPGRGDGGRPVCPVLRRPHPRCLSRGRAHLCGCDLVASPRARPPRLLTVGTRVSPNPSLLLDGARDLGRCAVLVSVGMGGPSGTATP